jgi:trimeric autotransporter adhesin
MIFTLLSFTLVAHAQSVSLTPNVAGSPQNFGNVVVGQKSTPRAFTVSGSGLVDDVTINIPSRFEGSLSSTSGFSTNAIVLSPSGGTLAPTTIYLRFAPTATGTINRTVFAFTLDTNGDVVASSPTISLTGNGVAGTPEILVSPTALGFQPQIINTTSAPQSVTVTGNSLSSPISVVAPSGFLVSYNGGTYASTTTLPAAGGTLDVVFQPTAVQNYVGNITLNSTGAAQATVQVSGQGTAVPANLSVTYSPNPLDFGSAQVGTATAAQSFTVNGSGLTSNVTVTAPANYQVRVGSNPFGTSAVIVPVGGSVSNVTVDVRFTPNATGTLAANVAVSAANAATQNVAVTGVGTPAPTGANINVSPTTLPFNNVTQSGSADILQLTVSGTNLGTNPITLTPSVANIQFRNVSAGATTFSSSPIVLSPVSGTVAPTTIEVRLTGPIAGGNFNERIDVTSPGASPVVVTVTATSNGNVSDISITNPTNNSFTFATRPATFSVSQSFLISGTNLLQDLVVAPTGQNASYFQVSKDNQNFFSSISFARDGQGNVVQQPVYVRFVPGSQAITVNALIRATSSPAPDRDVSVTGISEPTIRLLPAIGDFGNMVIKNTTSAPRTVRLETFLLTGPLSLYFPNDTEDPGRNPTGTPQFEFSTDGGATYVKSDTLLNNMDGNRILNLLVRYAPTRVGASTQPLTFTNAALNNGNPVTLLSGNGTASGFAIAEEPTAQSTAQIVRPTGSTVATITFDLSNAPAGQSYGQNRLVIASRDYTLLPTSLFPQDKQNFSPGVTQGGAYQYGTGTPIEVSSGTYVVFSGAANSFTVGNLDPGTNYYFYAFEFNDDGLLNAENYKVPNNQPQTPLPVELKSFTAKLNNGKVLLDWTTAQERNNRGFDVERSLDGKNFTKLGFVEGHLTSTVEHDYSFVDARPLAGTSYYRLRQVDTDGKYAYSPMVSVRNTTKGQGEVAVYPNPVADQVNVRLTSGDADATVVVTDLMGRTVLSGKLATDATFDVSSLKPGNYILTVISAAGKTNHKIVKQ